MTTVQYNVAAAADVPDAIQTSYARFTAGGFRRESCVSPGSRLIASHFTRMVYVTKNGMIRVLEPGNTLPVIDYHKSDTVNDIVAQSLSQEFMWASVASTRIVLWKNMIPILDLEIPIPPVKLIWHHTDMNRFWILCEEKTAVLIDLSLGVPNQSVHPVHQHPTGAVPKDLNKMPFVQKNVIDMAWSPFEMNTLVSIHTDGSLCLWQNSNNNLQQLLQIQSNITSITRCGFVGKDSILVASDENRCMTIFQGVDLIRIGVLKLVGTNDSFVMETLIPDVETSRIVLTSRDSGNALVVGLNLKSSSPFETVFPFHSTMAGHSFHCTVVPDAEIETTGGRAIKLTLYGPKEIQTWILQEQPISGVRPSSVEKALDDMSQQFADYTVEDEDEEEKETDDPVDTNVTSGPPGLANVIANNPFTNWIGNISAEMTVAPSVPQTHATIPSFSSPLLPKQSAPPTPQTMASQPALEIAKASPSPNPVASPPKMATASPTVAITDYPPSTRSLPPQPACSTSTSTSIDIKELTSSIRSIVKEELLQQSSAISAEVARNVMIPAIESIAQQILAKVSNHVEQQQAQSRSQLESMSEQLTKVTDLVSALTKDVKLIQKQQQQQQQHPQTRSTMQVTVEQKEKSIKDQVLRLLQQKQLGQALTVAFSSQTTDLTWQCCQEGDLSGSLETELESLSQEALFNTMERLSHHMKTRLSTESDQAETFLKWIQNICLALAELPINIDRNTANAVIQYTVTVCSEIKSPNRRMAMHLLKTLQQ